MMKFSTNFSHLILFSFVFFHINAQEVQSPTEFLASEYGNQFTPHHLLIDYVEHVSTQSDFATLKQYGETNEDRPLVLLYISIPENLAQIENYRESHMDALSGNGSIEDKVIVWLSFGVHGNEAGASESSMLVLYELTQGSEAIKDWLKNTIVILDPSINPDGYSRYTHWVRGISTELLQPETYAREHQEPWPQGRVNHYLFDLNRDWAWATQIETQQRLKEYNEWLPHIHVDFHEMGHDNHYYFAPAARPYHKSITNWQTEFQFEIGQNHAKQFDQEGWLYFTREVFDLFYPSYGDTYPTFNGAIGMTHEQAGHSRAGRAIHLENKDTLTLQDRIDHHLKTAISTVEVSSLNSDRLIDNMQEFFKRKDTGPYNSYVISRNESENFEELRRILDLHKIEYGQANANFSSKGFHFLTGLENNCPIKKGDLVIPTNQMKSVLVNTLFEPNPELEDSLTYDITAWALPFAHGVEAYGVSTAVEFDNFEKMEWENQDISSCTAVMVPYHLSNSSKVLSQLIQAKIHCRVNQKEIKYDDSTIPIGSLIITQADNRKNKNWRSTLIRLCHDIQIPYIPIKSGFAMSGPDLGSSSLSLIHSKRVGSMSGTGVYQNSFGQLWHFFENDLKYPLLIFNKDQLGESILDQLDVLILEEGYYSLSEKDLSTILSWIKKGGKLITIGDATGKFINAKDYGLKKKEKDKEKEENKKKAVLSNFAQEERKYIESFVPGAILQTTMDHTHPISYGLEKNYHTLRSNSKTIPMQTDVRNAVIVSKDFVQYGFIGNKRKQEMNDSLVVGVETKGKGTIVYFTDNPIYRGFWKAGSKMLTNAIFLVDE